MRKAPKTKRKGYQYGTDPNGIPPATDQQLDANGNPITTQAPNKDNRGLGEKISGSMGWLGYANQARGIAQNSVNKEQVVDPKTGQVITKGDTYGQDVIYNTATPYHEQVQTDIKNKDFTHIGSIFGGPAMEMAYNATIGKQKKDQRFEEAKIAQENQQAMEEAQAKRAAGQVNVSANTKQAPEHKQNIFQKADNKINSFFAKGGEVKGKGGPKSDSINAEIEEGSFVVPAEHAHVGKMIRNAMGKKNGKANLHQKNGVPVKLSDTEVVFSPEEKETIEKELGEEFLKSLAPNAEHEKMESHHEEMMEEGMAKGGELTAEKAKTMLRDNQANGQPLTDKQKRYFGWIAGGRKMAEGGEIPKGTTVLGATWDGKNWRRGATVYSKDGGKDFEEAYRKQTSKKDDTKEALNEYGKNFEAKHRSDLESEYESLKGKNDDYAKYRRKQIEKEIGVKPATKSGAELESLPETKATPIGQKTNTTKTTSKTPVKTVKSNIFNNTAWANSLKPTPVMEDNKEYPIVPTEDAIAAKEATNINANAVDTNPVTTKPSETKTTSSAGNFWDKVNGNGNLLNTGLSAFQIGIGLKGLNDGKRPVFTMDKTFDANVNKAQANAQYGFTPEQNYLIDQQNQNLLNQEIFAAKNFAGGSASNAYNMTRSAVNNAFNRGLEKQVAGTQLQMDKQSNANNLILQRNQLQRQIFEDSLNAFNQKQSSSANLLGAGISNALDANRFAQFMKLRQDENNFKNQYGV